MPSCNSHSEAFWKAFPSSPLFACLVSVPLNPHTSSSLPHAHKVRPCGSKTPNRPIPRLPLSQCLRILDRRAVSLMAGCPEFSELGPIIQLAFGSQSLICALRYKSGAKCPRQKCPLSPQCLQSIKLLTPCGTWGVCGLGRGGVIMVYVANVI